MASKEITYEIDATMYPKNGPCNKMEFTVRVTEDKLETKKVTISTDEAKYENLRKTTPTALPWAEFIKVLKPFLLGQSEAELEEAFKILDKDGSKLVDVKELIPFVAAFLPGCDGPTLEKHIKEIDKNADQKMSKAEFCQLCKRGIGTQILIADYQKK